MLGGVLKDLHRVVFNMETSNTSLLGTAWASELNTKILTSCAFYRSPSLNKHHISRRLLQAERGIQKKACSNRVDDGDEYTEEITRVLQNLDLASVHPLHWRVQCLVGIHQ